MTKSRSRPGHRDGDVRRREVDEVAPPLPNRVFRMTDEERQKIAKALRFIDEARRALQDQQNPDHREIIRELRASADQIFDVVNALEELPPLGELEE